MFVIVIATEGNPLVVIAVVLIAIFSSGSTVREPMNRRKFVRFTPKSGHVQCTSSCPLSAKSELMQCSKTTRIGAYSITSSEAQ